MRALTVCGNLLFQSKLDSFLAALNLTSILPSAYETTLDDMRQRPPHIVIIDLSYRKFDPLEFLTAIRSAEIGYRGPTLCYGPHVETEKLDRARRMGATEVVANSMMSAKGGALIAKLLGGATSEGA